jgi:arylamine N-acetyltransferase
MPSTKWRIGSPAATRKVHTSTISLPLGPVQSERGLRSSNDRFNVRHSEGRVERRTLTTQEELRGVLLDAFGLTLSEEELTTILTHVASRSTAGPPHPFFA